MLSSRAIALQGVGYAPAVVALQGFAAVGEPIAVSPAPTFGGGSGRPLRRRQRYVPAGGPDMSPWPKPRRPDDEETALHLLGLM